MVSDSSDILPPFSEDDLYRAYAVFCEESEARCLVRCTSAEIEEIRHYLSVPASGEDPRPGMRDIPGRPAFGMTLSMDLLAVLSLISSDGERKVARYRAISKPDPQDEADFFRRREELAPVVRAHFGGLPNN